MSGVAVHGFVEDMAPVKRLAAALAAPSALAALHVFPDGETLPIVPVDGARTVIFYRSLHHPNERLISLMLAADAYRRAGVPRLVLVAPYLCYLRQDKVFAPGQPLSRDVIGPMIGDAFDRVLTVQAHLHRTTDLTVALRAPADSLSIAGALASLAGGDARPLVVGPDRESEPWVREAADRLNSEWITFEKQRKGDHDVILTLPDAAIVAGRPVLLLDDVCSSGGTLEGAIGQLRQAGAVSIDVAVAHALFGPEIERRLVAAGARRILSSDSVPHSTNALELAGVLAAALQDEMRP
ncbi:MAG: ribose-phosphate diphosphokinase [Caulobacter sp.]|nr:ribose-phosphate diphosphokinase [Caulobacter sp.]